MPRPICGGYKMKKAIRRRVDLKLVHFFAYRSWARGYRSIKFLNSSEVPTKPMGRDPVVPPTPAKSVLSLRPFMWNSNHIHIYALNCEAVLAFFSSHVGDMPTVKPDIDRVNKLKAQVRIHVINIVFSVVCMPAGFL